MGLALLKQRLWPRWSRLLRPGGRPAVAVTLARMGLLAAGIDDPDHCARELNHVVSRDGCLGGICPIRSAAPARQADEIVMPVPFILRQCRQIEARWWIMRSICSKLFRHSCVFLRNGSRVPALGLGGWGRRDADRGDFPSLTRKECVVGVNILLIANICAYGADGASRANPSKGKRSIAGMRRRRRSRL